MLFSRHAAPVASSRAGRTLAASLLVGALIAGCAAGTSAGTSSRSSAAAETEYYYGTSSTTSPDGKVAYGPPVMMLVRRDVAPADDQIVETATREGRTLVTTLRRVEAGRFAASASDASFGGAIEFEGSEWSWNRWRYALELADGTGVIEGTGQIDGKWLEADRYLVAGSGERRSRITDRLARITKEEYDRRIGEMAKVAAPSSKRR